MNVIQDRVSRLGFIRLYLLYCTVLIILMVFTWFIGNILSDFAIISVLLMRVSAGMPLLLQLIFMILIFRRSDVGKEYVFIRYILIIYTVVCGMLSLFDLLFTIPDEYERLLMALIYSQLIFQLIIFTYTFLLVSSERIGRKVLIGEIGVVIYCVLILIVVAVFGIVFSDSNFVFLIFGMGHGLLLVLTGVISFNPILVYLLYSMKERQLIST